MIIKLTKSDIEDVLTEAFIGSSYLGDKLKNGRIKGMATYGRTLEVFVKYDPKTKEIYAEIK